MHSLQKQFHDFIFQRNLIDADDKALLAVSGGVDSMVMVHLFKEQNLDFAVAHCNYGLRGAESDADEAFVIDWTQANEVDCHVKHVELGAGSIQLNAREERYAWFSELCDKHGYTKIATAHHLDDSLETTLINLVRGTGPRGLVGIPVQSEQVIRPLLWATKAELMWYAQEQHIRWREDNSNAASYYDRNTLRLEVIPKLKELNPSLLHTYKQTRERISLANLMLMRRVAEVMEQYFNEAESSLDLKWVHQPDDLLVLSEILSSYGFNYVTVKEIHEAIGQSGKQFLSDRFVIHMDRTSLFVREKEKQSAGKLIIHEEGIYSLDEYTISVSLQAYNNEPIKNDPSVALLDASVATFPIKVRPWKEGDRFHPLGMRGSKKVSDFLIDRKVPIPLKEKTLVFEIEKSIAWVAPYQIADPFKISQNTRSVLELRLH